MWPLLSSAFRLGSTRARSGFMRSKDNEPRLREMTDRPQMRGEGNARGASGQETESKRGKVTIRNLEAHAAEEDSSAVGVVP